MLKYVSRPSFLHTRLPAFTALAIVLNTMIVPLPQFQRDVSATPVHPLADRVTDALGRKIGYLRLSLTTACAMRCTYCRPGWHTAEPHDKLLGVGEIEQIVRHMVDRHGVRKVRLTGGDPTSRRDLVPIIRAIARIGQITDLCMTTNGLTLASRAREYADAGLGRVNVSLDSLDRARFERLTGVDGLERVLAGIEAAKRAGLLPIRLNAVVLRGENDSELPALVRFASAGGMELRLIELMPMGPLADRWAERYVAEAEMRRRIEAVTVGQWQPMPQGHDAARRYRIALAGGGEAVVGFITPMSCNFCADCNRVRIASDGGIFPCLMDEPRGSLLPALRPRFDAGLFDLLLQQSFSYKQANHPHDGFATMTNIGG